MGKVVVDETTLVVVRPGRGGGRGEEEEEGRSVTRRCWREGADVGERALRQVGRCAGDHRSPSVCTQAPVSDFVCLCRSERPMATVACYRAACPHTSAAWLGGAGGPLRRRRRGGIGVEKSCRRPGAEKSARQRVEGGLRPMWQEFAVVAWLEGGGGCRSRASSPLHLRLNMSPAAAVSYLQTKQLFFPSLLSPRYVRRSGEGLIISYFQQLLHSGRGKADLGSLLLVVLFVCPRCCCGGVMDGAPDEARLLIG